MNTLTVNIRLRYFHISNTINMQSSIEIEFKLISLLKFYIEIQDWNLKLKFNLQLDWEILIFPFSRISALRELNVSYCFISRSSYFFLTYFRTSLLSLLVPSLLQSTCPSYCQGRPSEGERMVGGGVCYGWYRRDRSPALLSNHCGSLLRS